jgi:uncharacterized membrane protein
MGKSRIEAFSDGVFAIIITIMVLELKVPDGKTFVSLAHLTPKFLSYIFSFIYVGIYWQNHHHLFHSVTKINGKVLIYNLNLLFWFTLIPFTTAWLGESHFSRDAVLLYGLDLLVSALSYWRLEKVLLKQEGHHSSIHKAIATQYKEKFSIAGYLLGICLGFFLPYFGVAIFYLTAMLWAIPDRRLEQNSK